MQISLKTQAERTAKTPIPACHARVGSLCGFQDTVERVPTGNPKTGRRANVRQNNSTEAKRSGFGRKRRCSGMDETCRLRQMREHAETGKIERFWTPRRESGEKAGQSRGVVRAPRRSHLPAVRAVSGIYEGVPNTAKNSRRALRNEKSPPFQGKQRGSNEKHEVNTEKW